MVKEKTKAPHVPPVAPSPVPQAPSTNCDSLMLVLRLRGSTSPPPAERMPDACSTDACGDVSEPTVLRGTTSPPPAARMIDDATILPSPSDAYASSTDARGDVPEPTACDKPAQPTRRVPDAIIPPPPYLPRYCTLAVVR